MKILDSANVSKIDVLNATASVAFKKIKGETVQVKGVAIVEDADRETGEVRKFGYVWSDNAVYGGNSSTIVKTLEGLIELMNEDSGKHYSITVKGSETNSGREFLTLYISEE